MARKQRPARSLARAIEDLCAYIFRRRDAFACVKAGPAIEH
jgi:hypothetical protein